MTRSHLLFSGHLQFQYQSGQSQQNQSVHRDQSQQQNLTCLAISQTDQRHTNHQRVAENARQGQNSRPCISPVDKNQDEKQQHGHGQILHHRLKIELIQMNLAHGAKEHRLCQHHEHEVRQIAYRLALHQFGPARDKTHQDEQGHGQEG